MRKAIAARPRNAVVGLNGNDLDAAFPAADRDDGQSRHPVVTPLSL